MNKNKVYEAQALAIVMVVLVVSSIIGFSIYARSLKDKGLAIQERYSAEAYQVTDAILDNLMLSDSAALVEKLSTATGFFDYTNGAKREEKSGLSEITQLSEQLGHRLDFSNLSICPLSIDGNPTGNEYSVSLKEADTTARYEIAPGRIFGFPINGRDFGTSCTIDIFLEPRGTESTGFIVNKIYGRNYVDGTTTDMKPYEYGDTTNYCFSTNGSTCVDTTQFVGNNWVLWDKNATLTIPVEGVNGYALDSIQVTAVNGIVGINYRMNSCNTVLRLLQLRASATCNEVYRSKEILIPEGKWNFSIFDYVLFNGEGTL